MVGFVLAFVGLFLLAFSLEQKGIIKWMSMSGSLLCICLMAGTFTLCSRANQHLMQTYKNDGVFMDIEGNVFYSTQTSIEGFLYKKSYTPIGKFQCSSSIKECAKHLSDNHQEIAQTMKNNSNPISSYKK